MTIHRVRRIELNKRAIVAGIEAAAAGGSDA
jgi:hypothetical protein